MADNIAVVVSTTNAAAKDLLKFNAEDADGNLKNAEIIKVEDLESSDPAYPYSYRYVLKVDNITDTDCRVEAIYPKKSDILVDVVVTVPSYTVEVDAFARRALIKIIPEDPADLEILVNTARFYWENGQDVVQATQLTRDPEQGIVTISGLDPAKTYDAIGLSYGSKITAHCTPVKFTTEVETDVPNGDFSAANQKIEIKDIQVGGQYKIALTSYTLKSSIDRKLPDGWATINDLTCWTGSRNKNTWFLVPSTYETEGKVRLQNVGYHHDGTTPAATSGIYYCETPPKDLIKAAGELFLGTYTFDGSEHRKDGIPISSRPSYLQFDYSYLPEGDDKGLAEIRLLDASGNVVAENRLELTNTSQTVRDNTKIYLNTYPFLKDVASIEIIFKSSISNNPPIHVPSGNELDEGRTWTNFTSSKPLDTNGYHAVATGSVLEIDNVHLGYE